MRRIIPGGTNKTAKRFQDYVESAGRRPLVASVIGR